MRTAIVMLALALAACGKTEPAQSDTKAPTSQAPATVALPAGAAVHFVWPQDESTVYGDFTAVFAVNDMTVTPAGEQVEDKTRGHHHIIVDGGPIPAGTVVPKDDTHIHFGKGQGQTKLSLAPGKHTLTLQFADGNHISYGPQLATTISVEVVANPTPAPRVFFVAPADGAQVTSPVKVQFGLEGMTLTPAGEKVKDKTTGHHHVIVDGKPIEAGQMVPKDERNIHFGKAQTEAEIPLTPGKHTLTLQLADGLHMAYGPELSSTITVDVAAGDGAAQVAPGSDAAPGTAAPGTVAPGTVAPGTAAPEAGHEGHQH